MNEEARATHEKAIDPSVVCSACIDPKRIKLSVNWNGRQHLNLYDLGDTFGTRCWSQTFQRQNLIIFILDPKYSFELNQKAGDIYMNRAAIDEENQIEISGVYHLDHWEAHHGTTGFYSPWISDDFRYVVQKPTIHDS